MRFEPIASSSHGNAYLVEDSGCSLLLEAGIPFRRLQKSLDYRVQELAACLITHEHRDHAGHVGRILECGVPVYASPGTVEALGEGGIVPFLLPAGRNLGPPFAVGTFTVVPFRVFHDAAEPVGYLLRGSDGEQLAFATDTGGLAYKFPGVQIFALEANYEDELLARCAHLPDTVKQRVRATHMEIGRLCAYLEGLDLSACRELWLLHLSDASSHEGRFVDLVERAVGPGIAVRAAKRG